MGKSEKLPTINCVWIGKEMGPLHAACLRSFINHGHRVVLHCFEDVIDTPKGVEIFDATRLMKRSEIVANKGSGSLSLAADIYRLRMLQEGMGIYVDCDVYCLQPFENREYLFGWDAHTTWGDASSKRLLNNAVLRVPPNSELLNKMLDAAENPYFIPPWLSRSRNRRYRAYKALGFPIHISKQSWGVIGPQSLTYYATMLDLLHHAAPNDIFYFYRPDSHGSLMTDPGLSLNDLVTPRSRAIHFCSSGGVPNEIPLGSPLRHLLDNAQNGVSDITSKATRPLQKTRRSVLA